MTWTRRPGLLLGAAILLAGCDTPPRPSPSPTSPATLGAVATRPSSTQQGVLPGPYAAVATDLNTPGLTYQVLLVTSNARIAARASAHVPTFDSFTIRRLHVPGASTSSSRAYFLDGDTDIRWLSPDGSTGLVKSIPAGSTNDLAFAVSPDDRSIAVTVISRDLDPAAVAARTYVEDLSDGSGHRELSSTRGLQSMDWVVGWHGGSIVEAGGDLGCDASFGAQCVTSYRLVSAATGTTPAGLCAPASGLAGFTTPTGLPAAAGVAYADVLAASNPSGPSVGTIFAVDWIGHHHVFAARDSSAANALNGCFLSPDGSRMACISNDNQAIELLGPGGGITDLGFDYRILGWLDATHLLVAVDVQTLGVVAVDRGSTRLLPFSTDTIEFAGTLPNPL